MGRLSLFAIGITELRDIFGAAPELAQRLRSSTTRRFPAPATDHRHRGSLLGRVGPALKRPIDPPHAPARPTMADCEVLLAGRAVPPERLSYAWQIVLVWLDELSWGRLDVDLSTKQMTDIEFDLARAGLPTSYGMERLFQDNPQLPLRPLPAQRFGYSKNQHADATGQALSMVISDLSETSIPVVGQLLGFLNQFDDWSVRAAATGRPAPDLVAIWMD